MPILTRAALIGVFITLTACASTPNQLAGMTECTEPRPQMCTMQYDPVCAEHSDSSLNSHATDCTACSNPEVIGYIKGACPE